MLACGVAAAQPSRCEQALAYAKKGDLTRASIYMTGCEPTPEIKALKKRLQDSDLYQADIDSTPDGLTIEIDGIDEKIVTPAHVFLKPGTYNAKTTYNGVLYTQVIPAAARSRGPTLFITQQVVAKKDPKTQTIDMTDDSGGGDVHQTAAPKDIKHPPLTPDKYRGITTASGPPIDDPLALGPMQRHDREWAVGARIGGGLFDDATYEARPGVALAAVARSRVTELIVVDGRLDWSRRGGSALMDHAIDTIGLTPAIGMRIFEAETFVLAATAGPRIDVHLTSRQDDADISRFGISAVGALDVALQSVPITAGLRFEQGLTELRSGHRDHAMLLELGFDWR